MRFAAALLSPALPAEDVKTRPGLAGSHAAPTPSKSDEKLTASWVKPGLGNASNAGTSHQHRPRHVSFRVTRRTASQKALPDIDRQAGIISEPERFAARRDRRHGSRPPDQWPSIFPGSQGPTARLSNDAFATPADCIALRHCADVYAGDLHHAAGQASIRNAAGSRWRRADDQQRKSQPAPDVDPEHTGAVGHRFADIHRLEHSGARPPGSSSARFFHLIFVRPNSFLLWLPPWCIRTCIWFCAYVLPYRWTTDLDDRPRNSTSCLI